MGRRGRAPADVGGCCRILTVGLASAQDRGAAAGRRPGRRTRRPGRRRARDADRDVHVVCGRRGDSREIPGGQGVSPQLSWSGAPASCDELRARDARRRRGHSGREPDQ